MPLRARVTKCRTGINDPGYNALSFSRILPRRHWRRARRFPSNRLDRPGCQVNSTTRRIWNYQVGRERAADPYIVAGTDGAGPESPIPATTAPISADSIVCPARAAFRSAFRGCSCRTNAVYRGQDVFARRNCRTRKRLSACVCIRDKQPPLIKFGVLASGGCITSGA
jgi:hypothetical protein